MTGSDETLASWAPSAAAAWRPRRSRNRQMTLKIAYPAWDTSAQQAAVTGIFAEYEKQNPNVKIELISLPFPVLRQRLVVSARAGDPPDVAYVDGRWVPEMAAPGLLSDITEQRRQARPHRLVRRALEGRDARRPHLRGAGPHRPWLVYYNTELLPEGRHHQLSRRRWSELAEAAVKITGDGVYGWGLIGAKDASLISRFINFLYAFHGDLLTPDGKKSAFGQPESVAALRFYTDLLVKHKAAQPSAMANGLNDVNQLFMTGRVGMIIDGPWRQGIAARAGAEPEVGRRAAAAGRRQERRATSPRPGTTRCSRAGRTRRRPSSSSSSCCARRTWRRASSRCRRASRPRAIRASPPPTYKPWVDAIPNAIPVHGDRQVHRDRRRGRRCRPAGSRRPRRCREGGGGGEPEDRRASSAEHDEELHRCASPCWERASSPSSGPRSMRACRASRSSPCSAADAEKTRRVRPHAPTSATPRRAGISSSSGPAFDAVDLCLPNNRHLEYGLLAAAAGKHILCEKPLGMTEAEALADAGGGREGRRDPRLRREHDLRAGFPRDPRHRRARARSASRLWMRGREAHFGPHSPWFWKKAESGRRRADRHGVPPHRGLQHAARRGARLRCSATRRRCTTTPIATTSRIALLQYPGGTLGQCEASWIQRGGMQVTLEISGSEGMITYDRSGLSQPIKVFARNQVQRYFSREGRARPRLAVPDRRRILALRLLRPDPPLRRMHPDRRQAEGDLRRRRGREPHHGRRLCFGADRAPGSRSQA